LFYNADDVTLRRQDSVTVSPTAQSMSDRVELRERAASRRALRLQRESAYRAELERLGRQERKLTLSRSPAPDSPSALRAIGFFLQSPLPAKKAQVKGAVRRWLLEIGATDAAQSGLSFSRRVQLLIAHLHGPRTSRRDALSPEETLPPIVERTIAPGADWVGPLISVVVHAGLAQSADGAELLRRLSNQTLDRIEIVVWDPDLREAWRPDSPGERWLVDRDETLASTLLGRHAWVATAAARDLPPSFLEANVMALEGEQLDFTVNVFGMTEEGEQALQAGHVPGNGPDEILLTTGQASRLNDDLSWSFASNDDRSPSSAAQHVGGRLVTHRLDLDVSAPNRWTGTVDVNADRRADARWVASGSHLITVRPGRVAPTAMHRLRELDPDGAASPYAPRRDRVLVLFPFLAVGGAEVQALGVLRRLSSRFQFFVATTEPLAASLGSMVGDYLETTPHVYCLPEIIDRQLFFSAISGLIGRRHIGSVFVANGSNWIYDAAPALKARFPPLFLINQVFDHRMGWIQRYDASLVRTFDHHIAPNPAIADAYRRRGVGSDRISLIYHGIETARFAPEVVQPGRLAELRRELQLADGRPTVVMAGRLHPQKRPLDFVALASRVAPEEATFLLVGDGPLASDIDAQIARTGLPHLRRLPFHRPAAEILALADVVMILSEYEGLPLVLLEAQSLGTPVVATDVGAIRDALEWTGGGAVIPVGDLGAAETALRRILSSPPEMSRVRDQIRARFDVEASARAHAAVFGA
jgi:glycosyltransferase involved in cell wall biosynthesis